MSNNHEIDDSTDKTMSQLRKHLDTELSPELKKRLHQSRLQAINSLEKKPLFTIPTLLPVVGLSAALALGVGIAWNSLQYTDTPNYTVASDDLELDEMIFLAETQLDDDVFEILSSSTENPGLDFFSWASGQPEFLE